MFTGIVESTGRIAPPAGPNRIRVETELAAGLKTGGSIAVNGVCLTVTGRDGKGFDADVVPETLARTNLGGLGAGSRVNLERPLPAGGRLDGHIVQGHVDGTGTVEAIVAEAAGLRLAVRIPPELGRFVAEKGSIALDGMSLTVAAVEDDRVEIALIPHTLERTVAGEYGPGTVVNVEVDVMARYAARLLGGQ